MDVVLPTYSASLLFFMAVYSPDLDMLSGGVSMDATLLLSTGRVVNPTIRLTSDQR